LPWPVALALPRRAAAVAGTALPLPAGALSAKSRTLTLTLTRGLTMSLTRRSMAAMALPVAIRIEPPSASGPERKVRLLPLRSVTFRPRQGRPNQRTMDGPFINFRGALILDFHVGRVRGRSRRSGELALLFCSSLLVCFAVWHHVQLGWIHPCRICLYRNVVLVLIVGVHGKKTAAFTRVRRQRSGFLAPRRGHPGVLVFVLRVTRRAPRLLDVVFNHRNHRMVRNAALARTVVVENVTEPRPALLHEKSPLTDSVRRDSGKNLSAEPFGEGGACPP
jgi:hypothetical protein